MTFDKNSVNNTVVMTPMN